MLPCAFLRLSPASVQEKRSVASRPDVFTPLSHIASPMSVTAPLSRSSSSRITPLLNSVSDARADTVMRYAFSFFPRRNSTRLPADSRTSSMNPCNCQSVPSNVTVRSAAGSVKGTRSFPVTAKGRRGCKGCSDTTAAADTHPSAETAPRISSFSSPLKLAFKVTGCGVRVVFNCALSCIGQTPYVCTVPESCASPYCGIPTRQSPITRRPSSYVRDTVASFTCVTSRPCTNVQSSPLND